MFVNLNIKHTTVVNFRGVCNLYLDPETVPLFNACWTIGWWFPNLYMKNGWKSPNQKMVGFGVLGGVGGVGISPQIRVNIKTYLKPPPSHIQSYTVIYSTSNLQIPQFHLISIFFMMHFFLSACTLQLKWLITTPAVNKTSVFFLCLEPKWTAILEG